MSEPDSSLVDVAVSPFAPRTYVKTLPRWKKVFIIIGTVMLVVGVTMMFTESPPEIVPESGGTGTGGGESGGALTSNLIPGQPGEKGPGGQDPSAGTAAEPAWSEAFFRFGFSFFIGFAVGYAFRAFLKLVMIFAGILAICLFLLSYYGFVKVEWGAMDAAFNQFGGAIKGQMGAFKTFITGSLPNAGLAGLGLFTGFKKNG